jgi:SAM-dependent methyltransferase
MNKNNQKFQEQMHARARERVKEAIACLKLSGHDPRSGLLLDLGCGPGHLHKYFLKEGIESVGVEHIKRTIRRAKRSVPQGNFILADGYKLPFKEECFNTVIANDVLEHVPYNYARPMMNEVRRSLKTNGRFYTSVANRYQIHEPHTLIPFLTWFPRQCWNEIHKIIKKYPMKAMFYPYSLGMLKKLCRDTKFDYTDFTWIYALKKMSKTDYIGNQTVRRFAKLINTMGMSRAAQIIAEKVSIIVFVCTKQQI